MRRVLRFLLQVAMATFIALGSWALAQTGDYFQNYPGGFTRAAYQITSEELENPLTLTFQIEPEAGGQFTVTTTNRVTARRENLEAGVTSGVAQAQLIIQDEAVQALLENKRNLRPQASFILPGARFTSADRETIAGISVLCGMLTRSEKPAQRIFLAITEDSTLPFPPWIQQEEERSSGGMISSLRVCDSLAPLAQQSEKRYAILFQLELLDYERRE
ncbi:MAG: hypothetical protein A2Z21_01505 [Candidatus Fraserbacteria bacterium RBG_16_55_9]|uniref:Uncharacterized protein n=1 Tax=Fraserbacteria sp. (strain RBG_16_55_9) TaxID=1817864 RepID=A0A1F5UWW8_FRAXR|nr:MAG: hypothetical protein A2Z21_01505 [Candidatus Fraserbacteria bacterium RBG_16_55_9]